MVGDLDNSQVTEIISTLTLIFSGNGLRYLHHDNLMVCHFQSVETLEDIDEILSATLSDDVISYFLLPKPRQMGIRLEKDLEDHLINLKSKPNLGNSIKSETLQDDFQHISEIFSNIREEIKDLKQQKKEVDENYTVDGLLDKINTSGLDSLTKTEKNFLDQQSKK